MTSNLPTRPEPLVQLRYNAKAHVRKAYWNEPTISLGERA